MQIRLTRMASAAAACAALISLSSNLNAGPFGAYRVIDGHPMVNAASAAVQQPTRNGAVRIGDRRGMDDPMNHDANDDHRNHHRHRHHGPH